MATKKEFTQEEIKAMKEEWEKKTSNEYQEGYQAGLNSPQSKPKELKLLISVKDNMIETKGYHTPNLNRLELIGIYNLLDKQDKGTSDGIALYVKTEGDKMIIGETIHNNINGIPVSLIYNRLKQEIMRKIKLQLSINRKT